MSTRSLLRLSAYAALIAGVLRIVAAFLSPASLGTAAEFLYLVIDLALLAALPGIYLGRHEALGRSGFVGFAIALPALAAIVGPDGQLGGIDVYRVGGGLLILGLAVLAIAQLRARIGRTWSSMGWLAAFAATIVTALLPGRTWPFALLGLLFGAAFIAAGIELLRESPAPASTPGRADNLASARPLGTQ